LKDLKKWATVGAIPIVLIVVLVLFGLIAIGIIIAWKQILALLLGFVGIIIMFHPKYGEYLGDKKLFVGLGCLIFAVIIAVWG